MFAHLALSFFIKGGPVMWPLLGCFIASLFVVLDRWLWWWGLKRRRRPLVLNDTFEAISNGEFKRALELAADSPDPCLGAIQEGLRHAHSSFLGAMQLRAMDELERAEKRLWMLSTFITLAPLLGLLGTVTGIMNSFHFVGQEELAAVKVSGGIAEALIATACGLGIAILCLLPYNFFNRKLAQLRARLERTINHVELLAQSAKSHGFDLETFARDRSQRASSLV